MSKQGKVVVKALFTGGSAAGSIIANSIGPTGINIKDVIDAINEKTIPFKGLKVPVRIECDVEKKTFELFIETPSTASLILKEAGAEKGSSDCMNEKIGDITLDQVFTIVNAKKDKYLDKTFKACVKTVLGAAVSVGVMIEGEDPKVIQQRIDEGIYDQKLDGLEL